MNNNNFTFAIHTNECLMVTEFYENGCRIKRGPVKFGDKDLWVHAHVYEPVEGSNTHESIADAQNRVKKSLEILKDLQKNFLEKFPKEFCEKPYFGMVVESYLKIFDDHDNEGIDWYYNLINHKLNKLSKEQVNDILLSSSVSEACNLISSYLLPPTFEEFAALYECRKYE